MTDLQQRHDPVRRQFIIGTSVLGTGLAIGFAVPRPALSLIHI